MLVKLSADEILPPISGIELLISPRPLRVSETPLIVPLPAFANSLASVKTSEVSPSE